MLIAQPLAAQVVGDCPRPQGEAYLDVNGVRARILNNGALFYRGEPHVYDIEGANAVFAANIWIAGLMDGEVHAVATRYGEWELWPGPLDEQGNPPLDCGRYDRLWEITRTDLETYAQTGVPTPNLLDWPWRLGAPVLDGDGDPGNYNLEGGDRPALVGDQMLWWVMNDRGNEHRSTGSTPIGLEVHASAFAFYHPHSYLGRTTFYRFTLITKNTVPLEKAYFGSYLDTDLGNFSDDYLGSDSLLHLGYTYNADNFDEGGDGYGEAPPALGYVFLRTATDADERDNDHDGTIDEPGEQQGMASFMMMYGGGCAYCEPIRLGDYYNYMQGRWKDEQSVTYGGDGRHYSDIPVRYFWPGDPTTGVGWSEMNPAGDGSLPPDQAYDRRFTIATGPFQLEPGERQEVAFAVVWSRGSDHLDSVRQLKEDVANLRRVADDLLRPDTSVSVLREVPSYVLGFAPAYPNPFAESTTLRYSLPQRMRVRLAVYDLLGREVAVVVDAEQAAGVHGVEFEAGGLPPGVYVVRLRLDHLSFTKQLLLVR